MRQAAQFRLAVGFFDGVHLGHQAILRGADAALTFRAHPLSVLAPERAPRLVMTLDERLAAIRACGVGEVIVLDFTPELAALEPAEFARRHLAGATVRCGANWRFGKGGAGDPALLASLGVPVEVAPYAVAEGAPVSSSRIRAALERGELAAAAAMLGRPFAIAGAVVGGKGLGGTLGYPTLNVVPPAGGVELPRGAYVVEAGGCRGVANLGLAPTAGARAWKTPVLEVHLLEAPAAETPRTLRVDLLRFLRPERTFESLEALRRQIALDCAEAAR